ncbi:hypothetical protein PPYR_14421 [Photinus pyralis]|uniref:Uncharacterized protein n=2 Tax=Photinus pyralis TaxID=7054 RepID=A0A5N4A579_PHOPY|nr:15-hydroxyprostaglandin dehydrogenase [NAD(+)]-like [Photinus pyralis]KAB0792462.1 hypothetical protein PPYR_14421 [Photinus pyralis]
MNWVNKVSVPEMLFEIQGKIALVTGGVQGIGHEAVESLLNSGVKGVTLVDVNTAKGKTVADSLNARHGQGRVIFLPADVSDETQFENAFKESLNHWKGLDIVINNAGILNEDNWKMMVNTNTVGTIQGTFLGLKYMSKAKGGKGGVIVNVSSVAGIDDGCYFMPVYSATKSFVLTFGRYLANPLYYEHNEVRIVTACPGWTSTDLGRNLIDRLSNAISPHARDKAREILYKCPSQLASNVGDGIRKLIADGANGSVWVIESDEPPYELDPPKKEALRKKYSGT